MVCYCPYLDFSPDRDWLSLPQQWAWSWLAQEGGSRPHSRHFMLIERMSPCLNIYLILFWLSLYFTSLSSEEYSLRALFLVPQNEVVYSRVLLCLFLNVYVTFKITSWNLQGQRYSWAIKLSMCKSAPLLKLIVLLDEGTGKLKEECLWTVGKPRWMLDVLYFQVWTTQ